MVSPWYDILPASIFSRQFDGPLDRFGAAVGEKNIVDSARQNLRECTGVGHLGFHDKLTVNHGMQISICLCLNCIEHLIPAMTDISHTDTGDQIEPALAL